MAGRCHFAGNQLQALRVVEGNVVVGDLPKEEPGRDALESPAIHDAAVAAVLAKEIGEVGIARRLGVKCHARLQQPVGIEITPDKGSEPLGR